MAGLFKACFDCGSGQQRVLDAGMYSNPVIDMDFPDPFVLKYKDHWLAYGTNANGSNVQVLFFVARENATDRQSIGIAVCDRPEGPFQSKRDKPLISTPQEGGSIDPSCCLDDKGHCILYWKNDGNAIGQPTWIRAQPMTADGLELDGPGENLFCNDQGWEGHVIEAPFPYQKHGTVYLFYSGNDYGSPAYAVSYATSKDFAGPFKKSGDPILKSSNDQGEVSGPGACSLTEVNGVTWMLYHSWCPGARYRAMSLARVEWQGGVPHVQPSYGRPQQAPFS